MKAKTTQALNPLLKSFIGAALALLAYLSPFALHAAEIPKVGDKAPDFTLRSLDDKTVRLSELTAKGNVEA